MSLLLIDQVRAYVADEGKGPTILGGAHDFEDADIEAAAAAAVRTYNELAPSTLLCSGIDARYNFWFDGIASHLYSFLTQKLMRQDIDFTAGEVVVSPVAKQLRACEALQSRYAAAFEKGASRHKITLNLRNARGRIG